MNNWIVYAVWVILTLWSLIEMSGIYALITNPGLEYSRVSNIVTSFWVVAIVFWISYRFFG